MKFLDLELMLKLLRLWGCWDGINVFSMWEGHEFEGTREQTVMG